MNFLQVIILSVVQGLTEFLPISSSGHLALIQNLFKLASPPVFFDILLHLGTVLSILVFFKKDIVELVNNWQKNLTVWKVIIIGSIPAGIFGYLLNSRIEMIFGSLTLVGVAMIICGFILLSTKFINYREDLLRGTPLRRGSLILCRLLRLSRIRRVEIKKQKEVTELKNISFFKSIIIGLFQAMAILPGISRSGSTIAGGLWQGLSKDAVFKFSFLLSIPAILGAALLKAKDANFSEVSILVSILAIFISAFVGFFSLKFLQKVLKSDKFWLFSLYCFLVGISVLVFIK